MVGCTIGCHKVGFAFESIEPVCGVPIVPMCILFDVLTMSQAQSVFVDRRTGKLSI